MKKRKVLVLVKPVGGEITPFDGAALEAALSLEGAEVSVLSMAPPASRDALTALTRLGDLRVILLSDPLYAGSDTLATARILCAALDRIPHDLIFCGRQSTDGDTAQVGPCLAALRGVPALTNAMEMPVLTGKTVSVRTRFGREKAPLPALLTFERFAILRAPSIFSRAREIELWDNKTVGADPALCGPEGSPTRVLEAKENEGGRRSCRFITPEELPALLKELSGRGAKEEIWPEAERKLPHIAVIGERPYRRAAAVAERVSVIRETEPEAILREVERLAPSAVLFPADLWGRRTAPALQARLGCGLCADCTDLKTDGRSLFLYRPARSGNVIAKIVSAGLPLATVRCPEASGDLIVAAGRGVAGELDRVQAFSDSLGAELCCSRPLVDDGLLPYERQVGLTGRTVTPSVYLAVGISGAVRHTCAIENAGTVVAWNPDRSARIFDCADYGIAAPF